MKKNYERKHYFIVSTITLIVLSPLIIWLLPYTVQRVLFDMSNTESAWMIETPSITYRFFMIAWLFLLIGSVTAYFYYKRKIAIIFSCTVLAACFMYFGLKPITVLNSAGFIFVDSPFEDQVKYSWEDVEKVYLIIDDSTKEQSLEFHYKDNEIFMLTNRNDVQNMRSILINISKTYEFPFTTKEN
ncbi:hypothetical protein [Sutcliffiella sp. NC1]|uniref:hypothetical protein n=1 Tax=Sutcliffiella sp. NC1 TaxID=3004096 RepID=UPI0022DD13D0|nr:hypothetical protein [Sutcliffiella sp. NC1]WBL16960.1 hypothetical protein O1A01_10150 [Sutcliffiella sp. NC1]